jgi:hypothetical protein
VTELFDTNKIQILNFFPESEIKASIIYLREFGAEIFFAARNLLIYTNMKWLPRILKPS